MEDRLFLFKLLKEVPSSIRRQIPIEKLSKEESYTLEDFEKARPFFEGPLLAYHGSEEETRKYLKAEQAKGKTGDEIFMEHPVFKTLKKVNESMVGSNLTEMSNNLSSLKISQEDKDVFQKLGSYLQKKCNDISEHIAEIIEDDGKEYWKKRISDSILSSRRALAKELNISHPVLNNWLKVFFGDRFDGGKNGKDSRKLNFEEVLEIYSALGLSSKERKNKENADLVRRLDEGLFYEINRDELDSDLNKKLEESGLGKRTKKIPYSWILDLRLPEKSYLL